ncbi:MAG: hypothetical protein RL134_117 [Actinomycetota bacterium]|jgi:nicotinamide riboside transporter PnuC
MAETVGQRRVVGIVWILAAVVGIGLAFVVQPMGEWGLLATVLAILLMVLGATGLWVAVTGKGRMLGRGASVTKSRIWSILGLVGATLVVLSYLVGDWANWTALDVIGIALWAALGAMFLEGIIATRKTA